MNTLRQPLLREITTALLLAVLLLQSATAVAPGPAWWGRQSVVDPYAIPDDFAVANTGQLKYLAAKAAAAMNAELPGGAGATINSMVAAWNATPAAGVTRDNYLAINQGQLKQVAAPFYDRLGLPYPWAGSSGMRDDYLLVNQGQLKHVFSFDLKFRTLGQGPVQIPATVLQAALDAWNALPVKPLGSSAGDFDGDGIANLQEYLMGNALFDPLDIDGDRIADSIEDASGGILSKLDFADAVRDHDGDGVMNFEEVLLGLNLASASTSGRADGLTDAEVLAWGLAAGMPLTASTDAVRALWEVIDAEWLGANVGGDYYLYWLNEADANNDSLPDGLAAFRADVANFVWQPPSIWRAYPEDCDGDSVPDLWEYRYAFDLRDGQDAWDDPDEDELVNQNEYQAGTNPRLADSDGDGFDDGAEYTLGGDPLDGTVGLPLVLTLVAGSYQSVAAGGASAPLSVKVTQGGQPVLGAVVVFAVNSGGGVLRSGTSNASTGTQVTITTGADGSASVTYLAEVTVGSASVTAALAADSAQSTGFALSIATAPVTPMFGAPFGGGAFGGGSSNGPVESNPFEEVSLLVGYKWMNAAYGYDTHDDEKRNYFWGYIGDHYRSPSFVATFQDTEDKRAQVKQRFEQERVTLLGSPLSWSWIPTVSFSRHYYNVTDGPHYNKEYEHDDYHRSVVSLKAQREVAQAEQPEVTILALVYRDAENNGYTPDPRDPSKLKASGVIRVKGSASTWSPSLNAYCQKKGDAVFVDAVADSIPEKTNGYVFIDLIPIDLVPDWNRDGKIDTADRGKVSSQKPWRFWVNDDNDDNETDGSDIPNSAGGNGLDTKVNKLRDLNDFFPLWLDIGAALNAMPETEYDYVLESDTHALQFIETDLGVSNVKKFLTGELGSTSVMDNPNAIALHSTIKSVYQQQGKLSQTFLSKAKTGGKGVLLIEAFKPTQSALKLVIRKKSGGGSPAEFPMPLNIQSVEKMYRHLNLLGAAGGSGGRPNEMGEPTNYPDELCNTKNFVFVHGYNVNPDQARGWAAETFKRLWWSGSKAKYVAVTWHGSETQEMTGGAATPNYYVNVDNAFSTAEALKNALAALPGEKMVAAHSLGNMVVGSALSDWNAPIDKYIAIDGAVAMESWDGGATKSNDMVHLDWDNPQTQGTYPERLWASEWHQLWPTGDARNKLTWRERVGNHRSAQVFNFHSSGEEVLAAHPHAEMPDISDIVTSGVGRYAWALGEKTKGRMHTDLVMGSHSGGWGFSSAYDTTKDAQDNPVYPLTLPDPAQTASITDAQLRLEPFFRAKTFVSTDLDPALFGADGSQYAQEHRNTLLARAIPARTLPVGANAVTALGSQSNLDMNQLFKAGWPQSRRDSDSTDWRHSDMREVAYTYIYKMFDKIVTLGGLSQ